MRAPLLRALALFLLLFGTWGCDFSVDSPVSARNECKTDRECGGGRCALDLGICVSDQTAPFAVGLEVILGGGSANDRARNYIFAPYLVEAGMAGIELSLPSSVNIAGNVRWRAQGQLVSSKISFLRRDPLSTLATTSNQSAGFSALGAQTETRMNPITAADGQAADYLTKVFQGGLYDILVEPDGDAIYELPPLRFENISVPEDRSFARFDVAYPAQLSELQGVVYGEAVTQGGATEPRNGLQVRAVEVESRRVISSTAITGTRGQPPGGFRIRIDPSRALCNCFVLEISAGQDQPLFPTVRVDPQYFFLGASEASILVPTLPSIRYEGRVVSDAESGELPIPNAVLTFLSETVFDESTKLKGSFRVSALSSNEGRFAVDLLPGDYQVVVTPAETQAWSVVAQKLAIRSPVRAGPEEAVFRVSPRIPLTGSIQTWDARSVLGVRVSALSLRDASASAAEARFNRSFEISSDQKGSFRLALDQGDYDLLMRPSEESRLPWLSQRDLQARFDPNAGNLVADQPYVLPLPFVVRGRVISAEGEAVKNAEVLVYDLPASMPSGVAPDDGAAAPSPTVVVSTRGRAIQIGRALTDDQGNYVLLLQPRAP